MSPTAPTASVVIPAHNEAAVIERNLHALFAGVGRDEFDVVVACNGCRDDTAERARACGYPVRVLELTEASKPAALRAGDRTARAFPRLYLDADVVLPGPSARRVVERLRAGAVAARPPLRYDAGGAAPLVRRYYRARTEMPSVLGSLWGAGVYGLSETGRARFDTFPDITADDLWLDRQFAPSEIEIVECAPVLVSVPRRSRDLMRILRRTYKGKVENRPGATPDARALQTTASAVADLRRLAVRGPRGALDASTYAAFATGARLALAIDTRRPGAGTWERDDSSRLGTS